MIFSIRTTEILFRVIFEFVTDYETGRDSRCTNEGNLEKF
jgi:hypothetical protein